MIYLIKVYNIVNITVTSLTNKKKTIILNKITFILEFFINLVFFTRAKAIGIF